MLQRIVIQNFQSLRKVDIELGRFTVIVGASSSGKSAFIRAVRALASNLRGSSAISVGEKSMAIAAYSENNIVSLQKSGATGKYLLTNRSTGEEEKFSKLNQKVPEQITEALRIKPLSKDVPSINFAGQHDLPYLLGESASQVARVLGDLTNVSTIFEAVREANKKKISTGTLLKTRQSDFDLIVEQAQGFTSLKDRVAMVGIAEDRLEELLEEEGVVATLEALISSWSAVESLLGTHVTLQEIPSSEELEEAYAKYSSARADILSWAQSQKVLQDNLSTLETARSEEKLAHENFHAKLKELGTCPTCGQNL